MTQDTWVWVLGSIFGRILMSFGRPDEAVLAATSSQTSILEGSKFWGALGSIDRFGERCRWVLGGQMRPSWDKNRSYGVLELVLAGLGGQDLSNEFGALFGGGLLAAKIGSKSKKFEAAYMKPDPLHLKSRYNSQTTPKCSINIWNNLKNMKYQ